MGSRVQIGWPPLTRGVKVLLIIYGVVFLGQVIAELALGTERYGEVLTELAIYRPNFVRGHVWQIFTYQFLHSLDGWTHLLFNALALYFFGGQVEMREGTKRFMTVVPIFGAVAGLVVALVDIVEPLVFADPIDQVTLGASGAISAVIAGFCWLRWDQWINLFITQLKGKHLLLIFVAIDVLRGVLGGTNVSVVAHLAGTAVGLGYFSNKANPRLWWLKLKLWWVRRKLKVHDGGKDDRTYLN